VDQLKPFTGKGRRSIPALVPLLLLILARCANPVTPVGGPKDTSAPLVTETQPPDFSTEFPGRTIRITFDEFVDLDASPGKILISPPLRREPDFKLRGKTLICTLEDTLRPNATYSMDIGKAITDITEKNPLGIFLYVFSTGPFLDSLTIEGNVVGAFDLQPQKGIYVMVYLNDNDTIPFDSLPMKVKPRAVTTTDDQGVYHLRYLPDGAYRLIALQDLDGNMIYSMKGEQIGFCDSLVHPWYIPVEVPDTSVVDTVSPDTTVSVPFHGGKAVELRTFEEVDSVQVLTRYDLLRDNEVRLVFRYPVRALEIDRIHPDTIPDWCMREINPTRDTITLWTRPGIPDTLEIAISDDAMTTDTVTIDLRMKTAGKRPRRITEPVHKPLDATLGNMSGTLNYFKVPLLLRFSYPLTRYDLTRALMIHEKDTVHMTLKPYDSLHRVFSVPFPWEEGRTYKLLIPDSVFFSYNGLSNDTMRFLIRTPYLREFGSLTVDITVPPTTGKYLVQLLGEKEKVLEQHSINASGKVTYAFLSPGKYNVKVIDDANDNGRWDAGNFIHKIQPETVYYFPKAIEIHANWDVEEPWALMP
jgi:uncharacterized protein (DUF2141 family)